MSDEEDNNTESSEEEEEEIEELEESDLEELDEDYENSDDVAPTKLENPCEHFVEENFKKFKSSLDENLILSSHPREQAINYDVVKQLCSIQRNNSIIQDPHHTTVPILSKFEYTRILGIRATQIENGSPLFISVPESVIDSYVIARMELDAKKLPFIIRRPLPGGKMEYWRLADLENLNN
jgi:DNA-directed RNA polymerase subunit K/omega